MRALRTTPHPAPQKVAPMKRKGFIGAAFVQHLDRRAHYRSERRCALSTKFGLMVKCTPERGHNALFFIPLEVFIML